MSVDYDVSQSFKRIENELIDSMMRNFKRHRVEEAKEGFTWEQWQVLQLKELEKYRLANPKKFQGDFSEINKRVGDALQTTYTDAKSAEEAKILEQIKKGKIRQTRGSGAVAGKFFGVNAGRIEHLIEATKADFGRGEWAILRQANDQYRKIIFNAQMYSATGATYEQAVDMATKDFLKAGIQSITYKNGARHTMADYSRMALKTGQKRAYLMGEGDVHDKYGIHTVRVNKRTDACPLCVKWLGKVLVDDVYAGGTAEEAQKAGVPLLSEAIDEGFLHPNCKDVYTMYIEGVSKPADPWSKKELKEIADKYNAEQALQRAEDMQTSYERMAKNSLDPMNVQRYQARADAWGARAEQIRTGAPPTPIIPATPPTTAEPIIATETAEVVAPSTEEVARQNVKDAKKTLRPKQRQLEEKEAELKALKEAEKKWASLARWGDNTKERIANLAESRRKHRGLFDDEKVVLLLEKHFDVFKRGEVDDVLKKPLQAEIRPLKKEVKALTKDLDLRYDELEKIIGEPNVIELSTYGEKHLVPIRHFLDDAPATARSVWNKVADKFHVLAPYDRFNRRRTGAFYNPIAEGNGGVHLSINSVAKGDSIHAKYENVFHEFGHNMDYELNRRIGNGNRVESFTETYKDGAFGKRIMQEVEKAIEDFAQENGLSTAKKSDKISAQKAFNKHIKSEYSTLERANLSDMFEHAMLDKQDSYPFGAGHGKSYWKKDGAIHITVGKEAFAEMYASLITNPDALEVIKGFLPESYKIFEEILEVANAKL